MASLLALVPMRLAPMSARAKPRAANRQPSLRALAGETHKLDQPPRWVWGRQSSTATPDLPDNPFFSLFSLLSSIPSRQPPFRHSQSLRQQPRRPPCLLPSSLAPTRPSSSPMTVSRLPYVPGPCFRFWSYAQWMEELYIGINSRRDICGRRRKKKKKIEPGMLSKEEMRASTTKKKKKNWADL